MASNYPTSIDSFTDPISTSPLNSPSHAGQHQNINDAVEKLETKLGVGASPATGAVAGSALIANGSGTTTWSANAVGLWKITPSSVTNGTLSGSVVTVGTAVSSVTINGAFNSDYTNYRVIFSGGTQSAADTTLYVKFENVLTTYYSCGQYIAFSGATGIHTNNGSADGIGVGITSNVSSNAVIFDVFEPNSAKYTKAIGQSVGDGYKADYSGVMKTGTAYTTLIIRPNSGTMTGGTIRIYGYNN